MKTAQSNCKHRSHQSQSFSSDTVNSGGIGTEERVDKSEELSEMDDKEVGDKEVWNEFARRFSKVQKVLERNRDLIQQVNENHLSRCPDSMARNVSLIQELNGNIAKVVSAYSDLSTNFTDVVLQQRQQQDAAGGDSADSKTSERSGGRGETDEVLRDLGR